MFPKSWRRLCVGDVEDKYNTKNKKNKEINEECVVDIRYVRLWENLQPYSCGINAIRKGETICFTKLNIRKERIRK